MAKQLQLSLSEKELVRRLKVENELDLLEKYLKEKHAAMKKEIEVYSSGLSPAPTPKVKIQETIPSVDAEVAQQVINNKEVKVKSIKNLVSYKALLRDIDPNSISSEKHKKALIKFTKYLDDLDKVNKVHTPEDVKQMDEKVVEKIKRAAIQYNELNQFYVIDEDKYFELIQAHTIVSNAKKESFSIKVPAIMYAADKPKKGKLTSQEIEKKIKVEALKLGDGLTVNETKIGAKKAAQSIIDTKKNPSPLAGIKPAPAKLATAPTAKPAAAKPTATAKPVSAKPAPSKPAAAPSKPTVPQTPVDQAAYVRNLKGIEDSHFKAYKDNNNTNLPKFSVEEAYDNINKAYDKKTGANNQVNAQQDVQKSPSLIEHTQLEKTREYARISQLLASLPARPVIMNEPEELKAKKIALDKVITSFKTVSVEDIAFSPEKETIIMKLKHLIEVNKRLNEEVRSNQEKGKYLDAKYRIEAENDKRDLMNRKTQEIQTSEQIKALIDQRVKLLQEDNAKKIIAQKEKIEEDLKIQYIKHEELAIRNQQIINKLEEMLRLGRRQIAHKQIKMILRKIKNNEAKGIFIPVDAIPFTNTIVRNPDEKINVTFEKDDLRVIAKVIDPTIEAQRAAGKNVDEIKADIINESIPKNPSKVYVLEKYKNKSHFDRPIYMEAYAEAKYEKIEGEVLKEIGAMFEEATELYKTKIEHANRIVQEADALKNNALAYNELSINRNKVIDRELYNNAAVFLSHEKLEAQQYRMERKQFLLAEKARLAEERIQEKARLAEERAKNIELQRQERERRNQELIVLKQKSEELKQQKETERALAKAAQLKALEEAKLARETAKVIKPEVKIDEKRVNEIINVDKPKEIEKPKAIEAKPKHVDISLEKLKKDVKSEIDLIEEDEIFKLLATKELKPTKKTEVIKVANKQESVKTKTTTTTTKTTKAITVTKKPKK